MKKSIQVTILATLLVVPFACSDDFLDQDNTNTVSSGTFWNNPEDVEKAVNGMFHPITNTFFWGRIIHTGAMLRSDAFNVRPYGTNTAMSTFQGEAGVARWATELWQEAYKCIYRANEVLANVNEDNVSDAAQRKGFIGQAHFMRAFSYWYLVNLYGRVPIVTSVPTTTEDFFPDQSEASVVWGQVIDDLTDAIDLLPDSWPSDDAGRPTSGSALALRGKSYLYQNNLPLAEADFKSVINSGNYSLLPAERYHENFDESNENNEESIFELQYLGIASFSWGVDIPGVGTMGNFHIDYAPPSKSPDQGHYVNSWVKDLFETHSDIIRRNQTVAYAYPGSTGYGGTDFIEDFYQ